MNPFQNWKAVSALPISSAGNGIVICSVKRPI